jgi:hypothetical protein
MVSPLGATQWAASHAPAAWLSAGRRGGLYHRHGAPKSGAPRRGASRRPGGAASGPSAGGSDAGGSGRGDRPPQPPNPGGSPGTALPSDCEGYSCALCLLGCLVGVGGCARDAGPASRVARVVWVGSRATTRWLGAGVRMRPRGVAEGGRRRVSSPGAGKMALYLLRGLGRAVRPVKGLNGLKLVGSPPTLGEPGAAVPGRETASWARSAPVRRRHRRPSLRNAMMV